jgi:hypothetical protein
LEYYGHYYAFIVCREVRFSLLLGGTTTLNPRASLSSFDEGVELSFRNLNSSSGEWIPLMFFTSVDPSDRGGGIYIGNVTSSDRVQIRGYSVLYDSTIANDASISDVNLSICGSEIVQNNLFNHIQFRWLQTVRQAAGPNSDIVLLDNIEICSYSIKKNQILMDDFNDQTTLE